MRLFFECSIELVSCSLVAAAAAAAEGSCLRACADDRSLAAAVRAGPGRPAGCLEAAAGSQKLESLDREDVTFNVS